MSSKEKDFLITISVIYSVVTLITLFVNYYLISLFGLNQDNFFVIVIPMVVFSLIVFLSFSKNILKPLIKSDENLQKQLKETIHELNIPVSTIKMNTQMLKKKLDDEKHLKRLSRIDQASDDLLKLYENMEYEIKTSIDKVEITKVNLYEIVFNSLDKFKDLKKDISIDTNIPSNIDINTDKKGFQKVVDNLISNAIKYNLESNGQIKIEFKENILSIFNTGQTIDTKNLMIIFEQDFQENSEVEGFGLGLNIVKSFCDKHNILINIDVKQNGNQFNLNLKTLKNS